MNDVADMNDDMLFDRLVDCELSDEDRRNLIASLDARPDGWRRCALAFLEAQSLRTGMRSMLTDPVVPLAVKPAVAPVAKHSAKDAAAQGASRHWFAIAATIAVAFGLGWATSRPVLDAWRGPAIANSENGPAGATHLAQGGGESEALAANPDGAAAKVNPRDAVTLVVRDVTGTPRRLQVPLVDAPAGQWQPPADVRERLHDKGLDLMVRRRYAPIFFENADGLAPMVVPINDAVVTPVSREIY